MAVEIGSENYEIYICLIDNAVVSKQWKDEGRLYHRRANNGYREFFVEQTWMQIFPATVYSQSEEVQHYTKETGQPCVYFTILHLLHLLAEDHSIHLDQKMYAEMVANQWARTTSVDANHSL